MTRNGHNYPGAPQKWACSVKSRRRSLEDYWQKGRRQKLQEQYAERVAKGVCVRCAGPRLSPKLCWDCLNEMEGRYAVRL